MNRYFYTDPLAAAWMAKHFGMRFEAYFVPTDQMREILLPAIETHIHTHHLQIDGKFYVHPDSLPLLYPKPDDCGFDAQEFFCQYYNDAWYQDVTGRYGYYPVQIIQRDGKPFFWPECGESTLTTAPGVKPEQLECTQYSRKEK